MSFLPLAFTDRVFASGVAPLCPMPSSQTRAAGRGMMLLAHAGGEFDSVCAASEGPTSGSDFV